MVKLIYTDYLLYIYLKYVSYERSVNDKIVIFFVVKHLHLIKYDLIDFVYKIQKDNMSENRIKEYAMTQVSINYIEDINEDSLKNKN